MIWDLVIVTARTAQQRWLFERYLSRHLRPIPPAGEAGVAAPAAGRSGAPGYTVLQDPPGPQLGTAGATVHALCVAAQQLRERFATSRVLVLHCGGLSQRVPQLSHLGKAFAPGPASNPAEDGDPTLFARIVAELDHLFQEMEPGTVIACGDVLYRAPRLGVVCRSDEAVAVACRASAEQSSRHGVYLWHAGQDRVAESWQKPPVARLMELDGRRPWGLDTGILYLGAQVAGRVLRAAGVTRAEEAPAAFLRRKQEWQEVELYRDLTPPMTCAWQPEQRLVGVPGAVQNALAGVPLRLTCPDGAALLHFGTNEELIRILGAGAAPRLYASYITGGDLGPGVVLDRCFSECPIAVGAGSYVSGLHRTHQQLAIAAGRVAYQVPLRAPRGSAASRMTGGAPAVGSAPVTVFVTIGVGDDTKCHPEQGATLLSEPLVAWLRELGVSREVVWEGIPGPERSLWNARLFPMGEGEAAAEAVPWLSDLSDGRFGQRVDRWRRHPRTSMAEASRLFDARRWWRHEQRIDAHCFADRLEAAVRESDGAALGELLRTPGLSTAARRQARQRLQALGLSEPASMTGARAWVVAASLSQPPRAEEESDRGPRAGTREAGTASLRAQGPRSEWEQRAPFARGNPRSGHRVPAQWAGTHAVGGLASAGATKWVVGRGAAAVLRERGFQTLSRALVRETAPDSEDLEWQIAPGESIQVHAPVRVDLAGGWTDTPPQACERGGAVLNLALLLEGRRPLAARVERLDEPIVEVVAEDLACRRVLASSRLPGRPNPRDPFLIHQAALQLLGLFSDALLPQRLRRLGGGLRLTTAAQVPEGSGLGTSSILGAVVLAALNRAFGRSPSLETLCGDVLRLEQWMGTGGGWQDQVGGMWGGAKFAWSAPGIDPSPQVERLVLSPEVERGLSERMVLFYTGAPRLARDLLQRVVGRYLVGDPATLAALEEMPGLAHRARAALLAGDWEDLGRCLDRSWALNQQLEPTCSNPALAALFSRIAPLVTGAKLAGAGGGGFLFALARDRASREQLESLLASLPPPAKLYAASLDTHHPAFVIRQGPGSPPPLL